MSLRSMIATRRSSFAAAMAAFWPPGPEPITSTSKSYTRSSVTTSGRLLNPQGPVGSGRPRQPGLGPGRLEQLHRVAGRVLQQDLLAAHAGDDLVAETGTVLPQLRHRGRQIGDLDREAVPAAGLGQAAVRHGLAAAGTAARSAEHQPQIAAGQH